MFRNERSLYLVNCGLCKKRTVSIYAPDSPFQIYDYNCGVSDKGDRTSYGKEYDFSNLKLNGEPLDNLPRLCPGELRPTDVEEFATALKEIASAGWVFTGDEEVEAIRAERTESAERHMWD